MILGTSPPLQKIVLLKIAPESNYSPRKNVRLISVYTRTINTHIHTHTYTHTTNRRMYQWNCSMEITSSSNDPEQECGRNQAEWVFLKLSFTKAILNLLSWSYMTTWCPLIYDHLFMIITIYLCFKFIFVFSQARILNDSI